MRKNVFLISICPAPKNICGDYTIVSTRLAGANLIGRHSVKVNYDSTIVETRNLCRGPSQLSGFVCALHPLSCGLSMLFDDLFN